MQFCSNIITVLFFTINILYIAFRGGKFFRKNFILKLWLISGGSEEGVYLYFSVQEMDLLGGTWKVVFLLAGPFLLWQRIQDAVANVQYVLPLTGESISPDAI